MIDAERRPLVLYGAGSQAFVLESMIRSAGFDIVAVLSSTPPPSVFDLAVPVIVGKPAIEAWLSHSVAHLHYAISIGGNHGRVRVEYHRFLRERGLTPATLSHSTAHIGDRVTMGEACQILAFAFVGARARLGDAVILNTRASVDHECVLGDGVHLAPGVTLCGRVTIGANTFVGAGATVCPDVTIASDCVIGAGAVVIRDIPKSGTYVGVPARPLRGT